MMSRITHGKINRGSQRDLQVLINKRPELLNDEIIKVHPSLQNTEIKWVPPL